MVGKLAVAASVAVLAISAYMAQTRGTATYSIDEVRRAFTGQGYGTIEMWTGPRSIRTQGTFLLPKRANFYVFVARNDPIAKRFFAPLGKFGQGGGALDILRGNVVVSADGPVGPSDRRRIEAAMQSLDDS